MILYRGHYMWPHLESNNTKQQNFLALRVLLCLTLFVFLSKPAALDAQKCTFMLGTSRLRHDADCSVSMKVLFFPVWSEESRVNAKLND